MLGNARKVLISELAGGSNLKAKLANRYPEVESTEAARSILNEVQDKEHAGYSYENADGALISSFASILEDISRFLNRFILGYIPLAMTSDQTSMGLSRRVLRSS